MPDDECLDCEHNNSANQQQRPSACLLDLSGRVRAKEHRKASQSCADQAAYPPASPRGLQAGTNADRTSAGHNIVFQVGVRRQRRGLLVGKLEPRRPLQQSASQFRRHLRCLIAGPAAGPGNRHTMRYWPLEVSLVSQPAGVAATLY